RVTTEPSVYASAPAANKVRSFTYAGDAATAPIAAMLLRPRPQNGRQVSPPSEEKTSASSSPEDETTVAPTELVWTGPVTRSCSLLSCSISSDPSPGAVTPTKPALSAVGRGASTRSGETSSGSGSQFAPPSTLRSTSSPADAR